MLVLDAIKEFGTLWKWESNKDILRGDPSKLVYKIIQGIGYSNEPDVYGKFNDWYSTFDHAYNELNSTFSNFVGMLFHASLENKENEDNERYEQIKRSMCSPVQFEKIYITNLNDNIEIADLIPKKSPTLYVVFTNNTIFHANIRYMHIEKSCLAYYCLDKPWKNKYFLNFYKSIQSNSTKIYFSKDIDSMKLRILDFDSSVKKVFSSLEEAEKYIESQTA